MKVREQSSSQGRPIASVFADGRARWLALVVASGCLQTVTLLATAWTTQDVLSPILESGSRPPSTGVALLLALACVGAACRWTERVAAEQLGTRYVHEVRLALYDAITRCSEQNRRSTGINMVRFASDLTAVRQWVAMGIARTISAGLFLTGVIAAMWMLHPPSALRALCLLVAALGVVVVLGVRLEHTVRLTRQRRGRLSNLVADTLGQMREIVAFGRVRRERRRLERDSADLSRALRSRARWLAALRAFADLVHRLLMIVILVGGSRALLRGELPLATLLTLCSVTALLGSPLRDLGRVYEYRKNFLIAERKLLQVLGRVAAPRRTTRLPGGQGRLALTGIALNRSAKPNDLIIEPGQRVALLGGNGSGKSTLLAAIAGLDRPARGRVELDGVDTQLLRPLDRRKALGLASHRGRLATGSVGKNIRYRRPGATEAVVMQAVDAAGLGPWVASLERGLATRIADSVASVSEGEAARIKLARAVLACPRLLLLDEIEAGLDPDGRAALNALFDTYPGTIVFATHSAEFAARANQTWRLHQGVIHASPTTTTKPAEVITL